MQPCVVARISLFNGIPRRLCDYSLTILSIHPSFRFVSSSFSKNALKSATNTVICYVYVIGKKKLHATCMLCGWTLIAAIADSCVFSTMALGGQTSSTLSTWGIIHYCVQYSVAVWKFSTQQTQHVSTTIFSLQIYSFSIKYKEVSILIPFCFLFPYAHWVYDLFVCDGIKSNWLKSGHDSQYRDVSAHFGVLSLCT